MKKASIFVIVFLVLLSGCTKKAGQHNKAPKKVPMRIVSLAPSITEGLFMLGVGSRIVGVTVYCQRPEEAKTKTKIGTILKPDIEKIVSLKPDIVFATQEGNRKEIIEKIQSAGLNVFTFGKDESLNDIWDNFLLLGKIVGKQEKAVQILTDMDKRMAAVQARIECESSVTAFCELASEPLITAAKGSFVDELITMAGAVNIAHDEDVRYPNYSIEQVVMMDPDVIIIADMNRQMDKRINSALNKWSVFVQMKAVARNRIFLVDPYIICSPNPVALTEGFEEIAKMIHPKAFEEK